MESKKNTACDECRARKLKCSGESTGCERCKRDNVHCNYSPQKQMGRPRKRRRAEEDDGSAEALEDVQVMSNASSNLTTQWDQSWNSVCEEMIGGRLLTDEFAWANGGFLDLRSVEQRQQHVSGLIDELEMDVTVYQHQSALPATMGDLFQSTGPSCYIPSCTCSLDLFSAITTLQTTPPTANVQHCLLVSRGALATIKSSLVCSSCLGSLTTAYSSFMLLSIVLPLLVLFYRRTITAIGGLDDGCKGTAAATVKKEFGVLWEVVAEMERLSKRKPKIKDGPECGSVTDEDDPPVCHKILNTIKFIATTLVNECNALED